MSITIAAVIPLYNGEPFIGAALHSVLAQTRPADEVIVVNDGSTDEGPAIVEEIARHHPVRLMHKPNGGQSSARNLAIRSTTCSHIALLDQDDVWYEDHLAALHQPFVDAEIRRLGLVYGNLDQIDRNGRLITEHCLDHVPTPHPKRSLMQCLQHDMFILPGASLVDRQAMLDAGLFDERLSGYEDDDLFVRLYSMGVKSCYLDKSVTMWRIYPESTSFSARMARSRMIYFHKLIEAHPDEPRLGLFWRRDVIAPRFTSILRSEFLQASKAADFDRALRAWDDLKTVAPYMKKRVQMRIRLVGPLIEATLAGPLTSVARRLLRHALR
ncbi:glycosyltransferase family 2 protein [Xanthobacter autotrophicus]|uniref:glycosyltransferase family 2 protein n=1 Tax=Xanthobacter autotrophicus TaxID=280 RepID=UPI001E65C518|nr:glycosyltransferase family A protein [Xanthobacter autotrophicus]UDQ88818.1 glycosyltransferase family 2 protein [Xanthobacter autotrophicus]